MLAWGACRWTRLITVSNRCRSWYTATDDDALPPMSAQRGGDDGVHVVAAVEAEQAELGGQAVFDESGSPGLDALGHRCGVPRPGHPIRVEADHEHAGLRCGVHRRRLRRPPPTSPVPTAHTRPAGPSPPAE